MSDLPTQPVPCNVLELGWLWHAVADKAREGDPIARALYLKVKAAAIAAGVEWYYGDPWPLEDGSQGGEHPLQGAYAGVAGKEPG
jgi:hypothetical protein